MEPDEQKVDDTVLALLALWAFQDGPIWRTWKSLDWAVTDRLHEAGWIGDPRGKAKSITLTQEGLERGRELARRLFGVE